MLMAEGVKHITITTDDPAKYRGVDLPGGVDVVHRDSIVDAQEKLRAMDGVTVHIHDQQCAAEKRRDRKRGILAPATFRVMIDERVCEACGDCGVKSNCLSLHSTETEFGRKTVIDQASCNVDASCIKGDCPAFITVKPGKVGKAKRGSSTEIDLPEPKLAVPADVAIRMPGIGGTGVVTVSAVLAAAAQIAGVDATTADQTGLSQKAGPVVSTVTLDAGQPRRTRCRQQHRGRVDQHRSDRTDDRQGRIAWSRSLTAARRDQQAHHGRSQPVRRRRSHRHCLDG
jgi:indolepyruvate ferredoxin oxidoreductase